MAPALIGLGATGTVFSLSEFIFVKKAYCGEDKKLDHANEQAVFRCLEDLPRIPYLITCLHTIPKYTFLEFASNGSLAMKLNENQRCDKANPMHVLEVTNHLSANDICRWMWQLCICVNGLLDAGLAHNDICPANILFTSKWDLRLADLDRSDKIWEDAVALTPPFGRLLNKESGEYSGTYGKAGVRTETFAIGSVYYSLLRGHEPYKTEYWGDEHGALMIDKIQLKEFPQLSNSTENTVIRKCWNGEYTSVKELLAEFKIIRGDDGTEIKQRTSRMEECKGFVQSGILDSLGRTGKV